MTKKKVVNKNTVNITNKRPSRSIKQNQEGNKKIILASLVLALLIGILVYFQVTKTSLNNNEQLDKDNETIETIEDEELVPLEEIDEEDEPVNIVTQTVVKKSTESKSDVKEVYYALTFDSNGGETIDKQILSQDEETVNVIPTKEGWIFDAWYKDKDWNEKYEFGNNLEEDVTLYARWYRVVNYVIDGNIFSSANVFEDQFIPLLTKEDIDDTNPDYEITWVYYDKDEFDVVKPIEIKDDVLLSSINSTNSEINLFLNKLENFVLYFYESEDSNEAIFEQTVTEKREISFEEVNSKIEGLDKFAWYYRDADGSKITFAQNRLADKNINKLYLDEVYVVSFNDDETEEVIKEENVSKDSKMTEEMIPELEDKETSQFGGWISTNDEILDENLIITENKVFKPIWVTDNSVNEQTDTQEEVNQEQENNTNDDNLYETNNNEELQNNDESVDTNNVETNNEENDN